MVILKRLALDTSALETNKKSGSVCSKAVVIQSTNLYVNTVITTIVPGVFDLVLEELVFWICLLRVLLCVRSIFVHMQTVSSSAIVNHINGIHATINDVTGPDWSVLGLCNGFGCNLLQTMRGSEYNGGISAVLYTAYCTERSHTYAFIHLYSSIRLYAAYRSSYCID